MILLVILVEVKEAVVLTSFLEVADAVIWVALILLKEVI